jgi:hypothetical protein
MIKPRQKEKEQYDVDLDHRAKHHVREFFDEREKARKHPVKFTSHWPLTPEKALGKLTGRPTFAKAAAAFEYFFNTRMVRLGKRPWTSEMIREHAIEGEWTEDFFITSAREWLRYPRKGFRGAEQKERILKVFRELGIKSTWLEMDNKPKAK